MSWQLSKGARMPLHALLWHRGVYKKVDADEVIDFIAIAAQKKLVEWLEQKGLYVGWNVKEGDKATYLGCYILKWGKEENPTMGFVPLYDDDEWKALRKELGLEE